MNSFFASQFQDFIADYKGNMNLQLYVESSLSEKEKLGALGALHLLFKELKIEGPVFIAGGDNLSDFDSDYHLHSITKGSIQQTSYGLTGA